MKEKRLNEVKGVLLIAIGLMLLASLIHFDRLDLPLYTSHPNIPTKNFLGIFGAYLGGLIVFLFGLPSSYILPFLVLLLGIKFFRQQVPFLSIARTLGIFILLLSIASLIGMFNLTNEYMRFHMSGFLGSSTALFITSYFSRLGGFIIFSTFIILSLALVTEILISSLFKHIYDNVKVLAGLFKFERKEKIRVKTGVNERSLSEGKKGQILPIEKPKLTAVEAKEEDQIVRPKIQIKTAKPAATEVKVKPQELIIGDYHLPSLDFLENPPPVEAWQIKEDLEGSARILEQTLEDFDIQAKVTDIERGPNITRYELEPAPGVKVNRIEALEDDLALAMKAQSVRIIAPIPGKARVGIEVPNLKSTFVVLKEVIASKNFQEAKSKLTLALGKDITGQPIVADLDDMPHLLIAGTTGSGKTVCVNSLLLSLLFKNSPNELKFVMIDPKMVELMPFNGMPHLICPVVTDAKKAAQALNWAVSEMESRYQTLKEDGARNVEAYNEKHKDKSIPYIVVVVDEFADLMTVAPAQIENAVQRIAQLARAVGIHLILATQRPSVDVITGVIKANLPARISFKVASKVDSRTVLDMNGADKLLGKGDMLFLKPGDSKLTRIQGAMVKDAEIQRVVDFIKTQAGPVYNEEILKEKQQSGVGSMEKDELYDDAARIIMECNQASVSILQRRMNLGYVRAARIIDFMEQEGLVGPFEGSKPRKILVDRQSWLKENVKELAQGNN